MINCFYFLLQSSYILQIHILHDDHGECSHSELINHDILSFNSFQGIRQIAQYIIIDSGCDHTEIRRNQ